MTTEHDISTGPFEQSLWLDPETYHQARSLIDYLNSLSAEDLARSESLVFQDPEHPGWDFVEVPHPNNPDAMLIFAAPWPVFEGAEYAGFVWAIRKDGPRNRPTRHFGYRKGMSAEDYASLAFADKLIDAWPEVQGEHRAPEIQRFVSALIQKRLLLRDVRDAADYLNVTSFHPPLSDEQVSNAISRAISGPSQENQEVAGKAPDKVLIHYEPNNLVEVSDVVEQAMLSDPAHDPLFCYVGRFATVQKDGTIQILDKPALRERAMRTAKFSAVKGKTRQMARCPDDVVDTLFSRGGRNTAAALKGLLPTPTITPDGRVIDRPGCDPLTGLYGTFNYGDFWTLSERPTQTDAQTAFGFLVNEVFSEFPFAEQTDAAVAAVALLTGVLRRTVGLAPAFLFTSPTQGTGKTTLAALIGGVVMGKSPSATSWPDTEAESEKIIVSVLSYGASVLLFDNVKAGLGIDSAPLAKLLTSESFQGRLLGHSQMVSFPTSVLCLMTGNNVSPVGDATTRVLECRLDAQLERPDRRTFKRVDVLSWAGSRRAEIVCAALTITKAYLVNSTPELTESPTRFPMWDRMVRRPIIFAGGADVAAKTDHAHTADPSLDALRDVLTGWHAAFGDAALTTGEVIDRLNSGASFDANANGLETALRALVSDRRNIALTKQNLGVRMRQFAGRPIGGLVLKNTLDTHAKANKWSVVQIQ